MPLQALCMAVFDAVLVHVVNSVSAGGAWQRLKRQIIDALYADTDVFFLQEVATAFAPALRKTALGRAYAVIAPAATSASDQNSCILLDGAAFDTNSVVERTADVMALLGDSAVPVASGDLLVITADRVGGGACLLASFHGDTNGLATLPVLAAVHRLAASMPEHRLLFGLDANTYEHGSSSKQDVLAFARDYVSKGYTSCWGDTPNPTNYTTFNARTFLQPQLQKGCKGAEKASKGDRNPKDFILFSRQWAATAASRDNTGKREYTEGMVFPTLDFPSDHGIVAATLAPADN